MKIKIIKLLGLFLVFASMFCMTNSIYAKDLEISATTPINGKYEGVSFYSMAGAASDSRGKWGENHKEYYKTPTEWEVLDYVETNGNGSYAKATDTGHIASYSFVIHNKRFSKYGDYDYNDVPSPMDVNTAKYYIGYLNEDGTKTKYTNITGENSNINYMEIPRYSGSYTIYKPNPDIENYIYLTDNWLRPDDLSKIMENYDNYKYKEDDENYYFYISEPYAIRSTSGKLNSSNRNLNGKEVPLGIIDAYNFLYSSWDSYGGYDLCLMNVDGKLIIGSNFTKGHYGGNSFLNAYDNILKIPKGIINPREVYIRHVDSDTGKILKDESGNLLYNDSVILNNNTLLDRSNFTSKNKYSNEFPEYYTMGLNDTLKTNRLLTLVDNGTEYKFDGYTKVTSSTYNEAYKIATSNSSIKLEKITDKGTEVTVDKSNSTDVTIITYYYKKIDVPSTTPQGGIETLESNDILENCQITYTPTNADIKPYLVANKFKLKDLEYKYEKNNDNIQYKMVEFNIDKLISGYISDNEEYMQGDEKIGQIFGNSDEKWTLLEGRSPQEFPAQYNSIDIDTFYKEYQNMFPTQNQLDSFITSSNKNKTSKSDFSKKFTVPTNRYNGLRIPKLIANYEEYNVINPSKSTKTPSSDATSNTAKVLVYNPIKVKAPTIKSEGVVDHSNTKDTSVIQKNANFELSLESVNEEYYTGHPYSEYLDRYYLVFDIDIVKTDKTSYSKLYNVNSNSLTEIKVNEGQVIPHGTLIELSKDTTKFNAKASNNTDTGDIISQNKSNITLIGVSNNMPGEVLLREVLYNEKINTLNEIKVKNYISTESNEMYVINNSKTSVKRDYCDASVKYTDYKIHEARHYKGNDMFGDAYYFAKAVKEITNVGRIYDFKITDCSDIDYKKVFRETSNNGVNNLTGIVYFSGIKELKMYSNDVNTLEDRTDISISNSASKRILPLGPYKNTNTSYVNAPKMGYRISFDLKTSGYYKYTAENAITSTREIHITPSYYYISKDGKTFNNNINLYYKNSSGKYVKFVGSDYTIYFKPKDGYRSIYNAASGIDDDSIMSDQLEPLEIGSSEGFTLNYKMMSTSGNNFLQAWYGEFKLPNSTIAVEGNNVSKPLTDGYVGVIFNIQCIDNKGTTNEKILSYNQNNNNASPNTNTTQWDYEGFLGFSNPGSKSGDISIQLEKGTWIVNDYNVSPKAKYTDIKGTVVLFDLDNRAANDFD